MSSESHPAPISSAGGPDELAERILEDCREAVGEVRFGFGSKRQVWAFEEKHRIDVVRLVEDLSRADAPRFLRFAIAFHDEFVAVGNAWRVRNRIQALTAQLCGGADAALLENVSEALVDERLAVRHWLLAALLAGPRESAFQGLERALDRAYQPADQWAVLTRLRTLAEDLGRQFGPQTTRVVAELARLSADPEQRRRALELLARFGGAADSAALARAARGDADPGVRAHAAELLKIRDVI